MRIAIPIKRDNGPDSLVADHFGKAVDFALYDPETGQLQIVSVEARLEKQCLPVENLEDYDLKMVYVLGIGQKAVKCLKEKGIEIKTGKYKTVQEVIEHLDKLEKLETFCNETHGKD